MKEKAKLFYINGTDTGKLFDNLKGKNYAISPELIGKYADIVDIGKPTIGFAMDEIYSRISDNLHPSDQEVNIIFNMHGWPKGGDQKYQLSTRGEAIYPDKEKIEAILKVYERQGYSEKEVAALRKHSLQSKYEQVTSSAEEVIATIVRATNDRVVKIFAISCYGENLLKHVDMMPVGSSIITLSDANVPTNAVDLCSPSCEFILDFLFQGGFKLEKLIEVYALSQTNFQSTPRMAIKTDLLSYKVISLDEYATTMLQQSDLSFSSLIRPLLTNNNLTIVQIVEAVKGVRDLSDLKYSQDVAKQIVRFETMKQVISMVEIEMKNLETELAELSCKEDLIREFDELHSLQNKNAFYKAQLQEIDYVSLFAKIYPGLKFDINKIDGEIFQCFAPLIVNFLDSKYILQQEYSLEKQVMLAIECGKLEALKGLERPYDVVRLDVKTFEFLKLKSAINSCEHAKNWTNPALTDNLTPLAALRAGDVYEGGMPIYNIVLALAADHMIKTDYTSTILSGEDAEGSDAFDYSSAVENIAFG